ncbi:hypothetical protein Tco_0814995, partial [Tanacetum coccineum]
LHVWSRATFSKIGSRWGEVIDLEESSDDSFARKRICIKTSQEDNILERFKIIARGKVFILRAKELFVWAPSFKAAKEAGYCSDEDVNKDATNNIKDDGNYVNGDAESDVECVSDTVFADQEDTLGHVSPRKWQSAEKEVSSDPFNLNDLINRQGMQAKGAANSGCETSLPFPPGFTPDNVPIQNDVQVEAQGDASANSPLSCHSEGLSSRVMEDAQLINAHDSPRVEHNIKTGGSILDVLENMIKETKLDVLSDMAVKTLWGNHRFEFIISDAADGLLRKLLRRIEERARRLLLLVVKQYFGGSVSCIVVVAKKICGYLLLYGYFIFPEKRYDFQKKGHRRISVDIEPTYQTQCTNTELQGERAEHATPGTLSTIVDRTLSSRMNQQAFFTRERAFERRNTTEISQAIRPLMRCKKTRRSKGRPRVVHDAFQVRGTVNHVASDGTDIQYVGSSSIELEVGKGQPHIVHVKLEQGGLAAPLLARDTKTELGGFTYVKEVVKISSNFSAIVLKMEKIMTMIIQENNKSYWVGKGSTAIPDGTTNGLLISGVSVDPKKDKEFTSQRERKKFTTSTTGKGLLQAVPSGPSLGDCAVWKGDSLVKKTLSKEFLVSFSSSPALKGKGYLSTKLSEAMDFTDWCQSECVSGL